MEQKKILIVEDRPNFSNKLAKLFEKDGFSVFQSPSLQSALEIINKEKPDGISLDIQLEDGLGFNLISELITTDYYNGDMPVIVVVSSLIGLQTIPILNQHKIPYYDKSLPTFNPQIILDYFTFALQNLSTNSVSLQHQQNKANVSISTETTNEYGLKSLIKQELDVYKFNIKTIAYKRLVESIYYTLIPAENQADSLISIFIDVLEVDYNAAFVGLKKLFSDSFKENPNVFYEFYHQKSKEDLLALDIKEIPTPSEFIHHIVKKLAIQI